jgi:hypothetical protein
LKEFVSDVNALRQGTWDGRFYQSDRPTPLQPRNQERIRDLIDTYYPYLHFPKKAGNLIKLTSMPFQKLEPFFNEAYKNAVARIETINLFSQ